MGSNGEIEDNAQSPPGDERVLSALSSVQEISDVRERAAKATTWADRSSVIGLGVGYLVASVVIAVLGHTVPTLAEGVRLVVLILLYVLAFRTEFAAPGGATVPTEPVLVGLLLLTPPTLVPLAILVALQLANLGGEDSGQGMQRVLSSMISGWHCLGPVLVLWLLDPGPPAMAHWPVYVLALAAQFVADAGSALLRSAALGVAPRRLVGPLRWTFTIDALLAPLGLCVVIAADRAPDALLLLGLPILLMRLLARDRSEQLETAVVLGSALTQVKEEARVDVLTGIANRRAWQEALDDAQERTHDSPDLGTLVLAADVDGLKGVNDSFGHDAGDELIRSVAEVLLRAVGHEAVVARLGGDEFGVLIVAPDVKRVGDGLPARIRSHLALHPGVHGTPLSISIGVSTFPPATSVHHAAWLADQAAREDKVLRKVGRG
ncbi:MAG: GGDEF domain-containing protein [Kineosporiaceae bacterium]